MHTSKFRGASLRVWKEFLLNTPMKGEVKYRKINHTNLIIEFVKRSSLQLVIVCGIIIERRSVLCILSLWCCNFKVSERLGLLGNYFYSPKKTDFLRVWTYVTRKRYIVAYLMNYFNLKCFLGLDELF